MSSLPEPLDPNDPINILLRPFDPIPQAAVVDADLQQADDAQASQAARDAEAAEKQRKLAEEKANLLRQQTTAVNSSNATIFGGAEGEVLYEANVRPSARQWQSTNRVETKRSVVDFTMAEPLPPAQIVPDNAPSVLSPNARASPSFSQPVRVEMTTNVAAAPRVASPVAAKPAKAPPARPAPVAETAAPAAFSPTAGVHPTTSNKTEEFMKKVGGGSKVRQCPSFRMLEFQIQYDEYKQTKTAAS